MTATAYLVGAIDTRTDPPTFLGFDIFSEPAPTLSSKLFQFVVLQADGENYGEAQITLLEIIDNNHHEWCKRSLVKRGQSLPDMAGKEPADGQTRYQKMLTTILGFDKGALPTLGDIVDAVRSLVKHEQSLKHDVKMYESSMSEIAGLLFTDDEIEQGTPPAAIVKRVQAFKREYGEALDQLRDTQPVGYSFAGPILSPTAEQRTTIRGLFCRVKDNSLAQVTISALGIDESSMFKIALAFGIKELVWRVERDEKFL